MVARGGAKLGVVPDAVVHGPASIATREELVAALDGLRRRNPDGTTRQRITLATLAKGTGIPVSTIHSYLSGRTLPPPDALDAIVFVLGVRGRERGAWGDALDRVQTAVRRPVAEPAPRTMAPPLRDFVGRSDLLAEMTERWQRSKGRSPLLLLTGTGGIGKTSLALEWVHRHAEDFPDGALQVDLGGFGQEEPMSVSRAQRLLLTGLGVPTGQMPLDPDELTAFFRARLSAKRVVVLLDNARDSSRVHPLLTSAPLVTTIVTSRDTLRALAVAQGVTPIRVPVMDAEESAVLLSRAASHSVDSTRLSEVAAACAGLPLALRLSADSMLASPSAEQEADRLAALSLVVDGTDRGVRGVIDSTVQVLSPEARQLFIELGTLPGRHLSMLGVSIAAPGHREAALDELVGVNLLEQTPKGWRRHDLVGELASDLADQQPELVERRRALLRHYMGVVDRLLGASRNFLTVIPDHTGRVKLTADEAREVRDSELDTMVTLMGWGVDHGENVLVGQLIEALSAEALHHGGFEEFLPVAERLAHDEAAPTASRWNAWRALARAAQSAGDSEREIAAYREAEKLVADRGLDDELTLWVRIGVASALLVSSEVDEGRQTLRECIEACRRLGLHRLQALAENNLASDLFARQYNAEGIQLLEDSAHSAELAGAPDLAVLPLVNAAHMSTNVEALPGDPETWYQRAEQYLARADAVLTEHDTNEQFIAQLTRGALLRGRGELDAAVDLGRQTLALAEETNDAFNHREALIALASALSEAGALTEASEYQRQAVDRAAAMRDAPLELLTRLDLAAILARKGDDVEARVELKEAMTLRQGIEMAADFDGRLQRVQEMLDNPESSRRRP